MVTSQTRRNKVTRRQDSTRREVRAVEIHAIVQEVLGEVFTMDMEGSQFEKRDIFDVLIAAAVERITIEMACELLEDAPSANTVRSKVREMLGTEGALSELEKCVNEMLVSRLPGKLLDSHLPAAVDMTEIPYHGEHEEDDEYVRRSKAKAGTSHFHTFGTLYVIKKHKRYTLAVTLYRRSDTPLDLLKRLLERGDEVGLGLKRLYLDRGFDNNGVVAYLTDKPFPTILPLVVRGAKGGSRKLLTGRKSRQTTYTRQSQKYGALTLPLIIVCKYSKGRYKRRGLCRFAYVVIGQLSLPPAQVFDEYRCRFAIEASYRMMNTMRARTTSKSIHLRLFWMAMAFLLLNLWAYVKWLFLFHTQPGPRQVLHYLLPLARWRLWLWEVVKHRLGFSLSISIPAPS